MKILHSKVIGRLRRYLGTILHSKKKVTILVDNLDEGWERRDVLDDLAHFLFGLMSVARDIADDFNRDRLKRPGINLSIVIFLRSDIFSYIRQIVSEPDKLVSTQLRWHDRALLWQVVENRFRNFASNLPAEDSNWRDYFVSEVGGKVIDDYVLYRVLPRPRDLIYLFRSSLLNAKNRNHTRILEVDVKDAEIEYSKFAIDLLLAEVNMLNPEITTDVIYDFIGEDEIMSIEAVPI